VYSNVQRTQDWLTRTIDQALQPYVFQPNTPTTWGAVTTSLTGFLGPLWEQGAFAGTTASQAFVVVVGAGTTMTPQDIANGVMNVRVMFAPIQPSEFVVLTFQQQMATGG
jgi:phage tail sheath protein FI